MKTKKSDQEYFDELFDLYYEDLRGFVSSFVKDEEVARDLVHDLFLNIWKDRARLDPDRSVKSYLFTMARNRTLDHLKHQKVVQANRLQVITSYFEETVYSEEYEFRIKRVRERLEQLPEKQRQVVVKCCMEGKLYRQAAQELSVSENTIKTHLMRAMKFLREGLKEDMLLLFWLAGY